MLTRDELKQTGILRFSILFLLYCGVFYTVFNWLPPYLFADPINEYTARLLGFLLSGLGVQATVRGAVLAGGGFSVRIITECSAIFVAILFGSFVLSYPSTLRQKAVGLAVGVPFLFAANMVRLLLVYLVGMHHRPLFEISHVYIGQIGMILLVLLASIAWLRFVAGIKTKDTIGPFVLRFLAYSSVPFVLWLYIDDFYVLANLHAIKFILAAFHMDVSVPKELSLYPHTFNTFHLIAYSALVFATRSLERGRKLKMLWVGLAILCGTHFLFRLFQVLFFQFKAGFAFRPFVALIIINQWILPFALWLFFVRKELFKKKTVVCPVCGEEKLGIIDHIRSKHGRQAFNRKDVRALLEEMGKT